MRTVALFLCCFIGGVATAAPCVDPVLVPLGPPSVAPRCGHSAGAIAADGDQLFGAWVTFEYLLYERRFVPTTSGGVLDANGRLRQGEQRLYNEAAAPPSVATHDGISAVVWSVGGGTYIRFVDEAGTPAGDPVRVANGTSSSVHWDEQRWIVLAQEGTNVVALNVDVDGRVLARAAIAENATLIDAARGVAVVQTSAGFEVVPLDGVAVLARRALPGIAAAAHLSIDNNGDGYLVAWQAGGVLAQALDATGSPVDETLTMQAEPVEVIRLVVTGDVVLWGDQGSTRGARVGSAAVRPIDVTAGWLLDAVQSSAGVVALLTRGCGYVVTLRLAGDAFEQQDVVVSRGPAPQTPVAAVATASGHHVFWREWLPAENASRLYVTHVYGSAAADPVQLNPPGSAAFDVVAAVLLGDGSIVAWADVASNGPGGRYTSSRLRVARLGADGQLLAAPVEITTAMFINRLAVTVDESSIWVFAAEQRYLYYAELWRTRLDLKGQLLSRKLVTYAEVYGLDGAGSFMAWVQRLGDSRGLMVNDGGATRTFPMPDNVSFGKTAVAVGSVPLVVWLEDASPRQLHALFPESGADIIIANPAPGPFTVEASAASDGTFDVAWADGAGMHAVNVASTGLVVPRQELCFGMPILGW